jgi:gamma-glutamyl-gamma-aminobutyrate hydrolase PuuD
MHNELNIIGVQYHPERMTFDDFSNTLIQYLLSKSNKKTNKKLNLLNF